MDDLMEDALGAVRPPCVPLRWGWRLARTLTRQGERGVWTEKCELWL
jgi:hypothetical protein